MNQYNPSKINFRTRISSALKIPNIKKKTKGISPSDYPDHLVVVSQDSFEKVHLFRFQGLKFNLSHSSVGEKNQNSPKPVGTVVEPSLTSRIYDSQRSVNIRFDRYMSEASRPPDQSYSFHVTLTGTCPPSRTGGVSN